MNTQHKTPSVALVLLVCSWVAFPALGNELLHARISYESGGAMVQGTADDDWSYATLNTLILPGDNLWADKGATMELEMSGGSFLRMADGSKAEIQSLPPSASIRGWTGAFYVQRVARSTGGFLFITPACRVEIEKDSQVRIDIVGEGATTVTVHWGKAWIRTDTGAPMRILSGKRSFIDPGFLPSTPMPFDRSTEDSFDVWNRDRAKQLAGGQASFPKTVVDTYPVGGVDLASYGEWVYVDSHHYWRPTVHTTTFVPYRRGYWSYVSGCGYVWVGDYPFSYVTTHYGHWSYRSGYGWLWSYSSTWRPAAVATYRYGDNFVWCPVDPFGRPIHYGDLHYTVGGVRLSMTASSFCLAVDLLGGPCSASALYPTIVSHHHGSNVYIWNIYAPGGSVTINTGRWGGVSSTLQVRDYSPRRVIRGPSVTTHRAAPASARIATLEGTFGRTSFSRVSKTGQRGLRTPMTASSRSAHTRSARLDASAPRMTSSMITRADRTAPSNSSGKDPIRITSRPQQPASAPGGSPTASGARSNRVVVQGAPGTTSSSLDDSSRRRVPNTNTARSQGRTSTSYRANTRAQTDAPSTTRTPSRVVTPPQTQTRTPSTPSRIQSQPRVSTPSVSQRTQTRTQVHSAPPQRSISGYSPRTSVSRSTPSVSRTPSRAPSSSQNRSSSSYSPAPRQTTPQRTTPPVVSRAPSQSTRRSTTPSAPSFRSAPRTSPAPSVPKVSSPRPAPRRSVPAPTRSAPSRSISTPKRSTPSRSYSAPTRSAPTRSTPSISSRSTSRRGR